MRKIREVLRIESEARLGDRQIAEVLGTARSTVRECLRRARAAGPEHIECFIGDHTIQAASPATPRKSKPQHEARQ